MQKLKVLNTYISKISFEQSIENIFKLSVERSSSYVCFANVHMIMEAYKDKSFNEILSEAAIVTPDGAPVAKTMAYIYKYKQDRVAGMDLLPSILTAAAERGKSVYFYGSTQTVLDAIQKRVLKELPNLKVAGAYSPPFRKLTEQEDAEIVERINDSKADLIFVALGCPKQEKWMAKNKGKINGCMLGVGQAFLVYARLENRPPKWIRNLCLEWTFRLYLEPRRLWKRYLVNNPLFIMIIIKRALLKR